MAAAAARKNGELDTMQVNMTGAFTYSGFLHAIIVVILIFGLPHIKPELPPIEDAITIEIANIDEITQTNKQPNKANKPTPEKKPEKKQQPYQKDRPKAAPQVTAKKPPKPVEPSEPDLAVPERTEVAKKAPQPNKKPKPPKKEKQENQEQFDSVLKNLIKNEAAAEEQAPKAPIGEKLTITQRRLLQAQIGKQLGACWNLMAGARYAEDLVVKIRLHMTLDGMVKKAEVQDQFRYNTDSFFRAAADAALRAVKDPSCVPFDLPKDLYDYWKIIDTTFDPREMLL